MWPGRSGTEPSSRASTVRSACLGSISRKHAAGGRSVSQRSRFPSCACGRGNGHPPSAPVKPVASGLMFMPSLLILAACCRVRAGVLRLPPSAIALQFPPFALERIREMQSQPCFPARSFPSRCCRGGWEARIRLAAVRLYGLGSSAHLHGNRRSRPASNRPAGMGWAALLWPCARLAVAQKSGKDGGVWRIR